MIYDRDFFRLQLAFADKAAALCGLQLPRAFLAYTNLYVRFGLGRGFDPDQPVWREYLAGLREAQDACGWTYDFYLARASQPVVPPAFVARFGCFSYARLDNGDVRLHFENAEPDGHAPLGVERVGRRLAELADLFRHVKQACGPPRVIGASWLYNLEAYRRLFPRAYVATARVVPGRFQSFSLWGQFLDRHGRTKPAAADEFLARLARRESLDALDQCFPLPVIAVEAPVQEFYAFHGVE